MPKRQTNDVPSIETFVYIDYRITTRPANEFCEPDDYILNVHADIRGHPEDEEVTDRILGELRFFLIKVGEALNDGCDLLSMTDAYQETHDAACSVFSPSFSDYNRTVKRLFPEASPYNDILLLNRLIIDPVARGQRLGLIILHRVIRDFSSGCSLVMMKPFPLQFEVNAQEKSTWSQLKLDSFPQLQRPAFKGLSNYYARLGFKKIGKSEFYAICTAHSLPRSEDLQLSDAIQLPKSCFQKRSNHENKPEK